MIGYKALLILGDGMVLGMVAVGIYVAFQWLRFPDLTPDGSFVLGASVFAKLVHAGVPPTSATLAAGLAGGIAGCGTAVINGYARVPTVVSGLLVASALHSIVWLLLGKPNLFVEPEMTLVGLHRGSVGAAILVAWLGAIWLALVVALSVLGQTVSGLRL
jgi:putative tryptophan/tyrosine transport system permease protein